MQKGLKLVKLQLEYRNTIEKQKMYINEIYIWKDQNIRMYSEVYFNKMLHVIQNQTWFHIQYLIKYKIYEVIKLFVL